MADRTRRDVLRKSSAIGVAGMVAAALPAGAATGRGRGATTFVVVAGANGTAGSATELGLLGHRVVGVDLPGHGPTAAQFHRSYQAPQDLATFASLPSPVEGVKLDDYVEATVKVVRRAAEHGPVILVGGSMGGATISRVGNEVPHLLSRIVYDSAFCCVDLPSCLDYLLTPEGSTSLALTMPGVVGDPAKIGAARVNWRSADPDFLAAAKKAFMADADEAELLNLLNGLEPDETLDVPVADARVDARTWGRVPHTYIRHTRDRTVPLALQDRMIVEADALTPHNRFDVRSVDTSHVPTGSAWREIVRILDGLA